MVLKNKPKYTIIKNKGECLKILTFLTIANCEITIIFLMEGVIIMDVLDAINLLKMYGLYDKAQSECRQKKIAKAPYDMQGHHTEAAEEDYLLR